MDSFRLLKLSGRTFRFQLNKVLKYQLNKISVKNPWLNKILKYQLNNPFLIEEDFVERY